MKVAALVAGLAVVACDDDGGARTARGDGEPCSSSLDCGPGLGCNHGELADNFALGLCRAPAGRGEPCGFAHAPDELIGEALPAGYDGVDRGDCAEGLACAPRFPMPGSGEPPPMCAYSKGVACFFAGACEALASLPDGAPCGRPEACASGVCAVFDPPLSVVPIAGFGPGGDWLGPHVGLCVAPDDAIDECGRGHACAVDFTCLDRRCVAPHSQRPGALCSDVDGVECAFGLVCNGRECRYPVPDPP